MATAVVKKIKPRVDPEHLTDDRRELRIVATHRLAALDELAGRDIETALVENLSRNLHTLFDPVCDDVLPIYFGPLLGRLYLEGL